MSERNLEAFRREAIAALCASGKAANEAGDLESSLHALTRGLFDLLGDREAHLRPDALKEGERQFFVSGVFLIAPEEDGHILIAENGFPPEQHRLVIPIDLGHPGWMYRNRRPLVLPNTDEDAEFKQILKTARMGSIVIAPMIWQSHLHGMIIMAAQARYTMSQADLDILVAFSHLATAHYLAHDGPAFLKTLPTEHHFITTV